MFKLKTLAAAAALGLLGLPNAAIAEDYPDHPITLIAPFAPGGSSDPLARSLAEGLQKELGQPVVVENRAGAGGTIGIGMTVAAKPDGYTLALGGNGSIVFAEGVHKLNYSALKDLQPIGMVGSAQSAIVVNKSMGVSSLQDLIEHGKKEKLTFGSPGVGTALHLAGAQFAKLSGAQMVHIPYKGLAAALTDLQAGNIQVVFTNVAALSPFLQGDQLIPLAVISENRSPVLPNVPTAIEAGLPGMVMSTWYGIVGPAGLEDDRTAILEAALAAVVADPAFQERMKAMSMTVSEDPSSAAFAETLKSEFDKWLPLIEELGIAQQ